jgi:hypothetical protein
MAVDRIEAAFDELRSQFRAKAIRSFLDELEGQIADDDELREAITYRRRPSSPYFAVTFDRRPNDTTFSYPFADLVLVVLDRISGGTGIFKPINQLRVIRWNATDTDLLRALRTVSRANAQLRFHRILVVPYPVPPVGHRLDPKTYKK